MRPCAQNASGQTFTVWWKQQKMRCKMHTRICILAVSELADPVHMLFRLSFSCTVCCWKEMAVCRHKHVYLIKGPLCANFTYSTFLCSEYCSLLYLPQLLLTLTINGATQTGPVQKPVSIFCMQTLDFTFIVDLCLWILSYVIDLFPGVGEYNVLYKPFFHSRRSYIKSEKEKDSGVCSSKQVSLQALEPALHLCLWVEAQGFISCYCYYMAHTHWAASLVVELHEI